VTLEKLTFQTLIPSYQVDQCVRGNSCVLRFPVPSYLEDGILMSLSVHGSDRQHLSLYAMVQ